MKKYILRFKVKTLLLCKGTLCVFACLLVACSKPADSTRKPKFYQSPMHPWITSDKPGNCTICGMRLAPVYEGDASIAGGTLTINSSAMSLLGVNTVRVERTNIAKDVRVSGILEDDDTLHRVIAAFYEGRIEQVFVQQVGQYVKAGQPLASIYSPELLYVIREYQNGLARGKNDPVVQNTRHRLIQYGLSPEQVDALATQPRDHYAVNVIAPMDGTILVRNAYQGQYVKNGERLFEMGNLARMWFRAEIYERELPYVKLSQKALLTTPAVPGREFIGTVTFLDPNFDPLTRSTKVRIEVENPLSNEAGAYDRVLPHRAYAEASIRTVIDPVLAVPRSAVLRDGRREVAFVEKSPQQFEMRAVRTGRSGDEKIEIVEGLTEGELVVSQGNLMLDGETQLRLGANLVNASLVEKILPPEMDAFLKQISEISRALAADDIQKASQLSHDFNPPSSNFLESVPSEIFKRIHDLSGPPHGSSLQKFRETFLPWSEAAAHLALALKKASYIVPVKVFECPMASEAFPGAPQKALWIQQTADTQNPYFGTGMLTCGSEVQP